MPSKRPRRMLMRMTKRRMDKPADRRPMMLQLTVQ
jgi:hypothetical protein